MDYDDNDFQGQNLHLAGEGSSKISPVLRPYALPKFDFDDGLHGHLRFDNLVENEVFLGIPSQEDNQWIEDFSRGSSGIEFSSSAAESCSISRCNNVWSEATSSESVAMLLKSVGQEEIAPGETIVEESDAGHELGSLTKQMEPHMKQDDKVMDVMDSGPALRSEELLEHFSRLDDVEAASQTQDAEISTHGSSGASDPNASSGTCGLFVTQKNPEVDRKCDNENQVEADTSLNESLKYKMEKDSFGSGMQIDDIDSSSQNVPTSVDVLNNQESANQESDVNFENANVVLTHTCEAVGEHHILSKLVDTNDQIFKGNTFETGTNNLLLPCSSKMEPIEQHTVETRISNFEEPSSLPLKGDSGLQIAEGCVEDIRSTEPDKGSKCEPLYLSNSTGIHQQFKENMLEDLPVIYEGDSNLEGRTVEVNNMKAGICASSEVKMYPTQSTQGENSSVEGKNHLLGSQNQLDSEVSVSNSEASLLSGIDNKAFDGNGDGSSSNYVGIYSSLTVSRSTKFQGENHTSENLKDVGDVCGVHKEDLNAEDHVSFPVVAGSIQTHKEKLVSNPDDMHYDQDVYVNEKEKSKLPNDSISMEFDIVKSPSSDKRVRPSSQVEGMQVNNVVIHSSKCDTSARNEPALDFALENANLVLHSTMDGVPSLSGIGATEDQVTDQLEKNKKTEDEVLTESNLSSPKKNLERASEPGPVLELEKGASHNSADEHETVDHSLPVVETFNLASESEGAGNLLHKTDGQSLPTADTSSITSQSQHALKANEISEISSNKLEVCPTLCDSTVKQDDGAEGPVVLGNHEEIGKNNEVASSQVADVVLATNKCEVLTEPEPLSITLSESRCNRDQNDHEGGGASTVSDKPNSDTPTVISSTVLSQTEKGKKEGVKESVAKSVPLSEVTVKSTSTRQNASANDAATDERSFTFEVNPSASLSERETSKDGQSFPISEACKISTIVEGSPSTPGVSQIDSKMVQAISHGISQAPVGEIAHGGSKGTADRKRRRVSGKATGKDNPKRVNRVIETTPSKHTERGDKSCSMSMNIAGTSQLVQFDGSRPYGNVERSGTIPFGAVSIPTSTLPDLNNSALPSASFQQPFTDLQQVQLRAQIFVYGYLIQGAAPDEACMLSAFGASDGGRSVWEPVWRAFVEKLQGQKSLPNKSENSLQVSSGARPPDQSIKQSAVQSKVLSSPVGRASSKGTPSPVVNSIIPLSSPLWNVATPSCDGLQSSGMPRSGLLDYHHTMSPLHSFQTPPSRSFVGHSTSWLSQAPFPGPWIASPQTSTFDASARFSLPMTETVKLTPVKESFAPFPSGTKHASPSTVVHSTVPNVSAGTPFLPDMKKVTVSSGQNSTNLKSRKRKKVTVSENPAQISLLTQTQTEPVSAPVITSQLSTSIVVSTPDCFASKGNASKIVTAVSPMSLIDHPKRGEQKADDNATLSEDSFSKVEEAKRQAEDAGALAAAAVSESQAIWSRLNKQKSSGLNPDVEAKLASAAAAVAAAASVAKAAAAAAKIASNAAIQAKLMADEALISSGTSNSAQSNAASLSNVVNNLVKATPASILKGGDGSYLSSSIIVAAREAARRRVEAASAASKHAENLDAIVKAAELAAEAVSQAGIIVAMGNPLPLNELVEAGPQGYWKVPQVPREQVVISNNCIRELSKADSIEGLNVSGRHAKGGLSKKEVKTANFDLLPVSKEASRETLEDHTRAADIISSSFASSEKDSRGQRSHRVSDLAKNIAVIPESEIGSRSASIIAQDENENGVGTLKENSIKEGCLVEVHKDGDDDLKAAWYSANVLSLKGGKAFVVYLDLQSDEDSRQLKEWVALEGEGSSAPRIRINRRTSMRFEGTRKRRRAAMADYAWSVGDRVDAWIQDGWREGVVTEKDKKDDATFTVHFPAEGETSVVRAWHLRPTLIWKDGEWIEWSTSKERNPSSQGDTPQEKRMKLGSSAIEGREKDSIAKNVERVESGKLAESRLPISANETIFNVGKNTGDENKPDAVRTVRTGLQKEGSRVIFGIPKPGKKRKFMEVSKHYVADKSSKHNEPNDPVKFAKYLMPQGSGSRGWKNTKIHAKEKQPAESKTKFLKSGKPPSVSGRTLPQKKLSNSARYAQNEGKATDHVVKDSVSSDKNESGKQSQMEFGSLSSTDGVAEGPVLFSSLALPSDAPSKKISTSNAKSEWVNRRKPPPTTGKLAKVEVMNKLNSSNPGTSDSEVAEPRRSNRRIQPTSRLLEGLQSSLMISKIPAVLHDKSHRSQNKGSSKGNNHG